MRETADRLGVEDVRAVLRPHGLTVRELPGDTSTAPLAAAALATGVETIVKSLLFLAGQDPVLMLVAGDRRGDAALLAEELGAATIRLARPADVIRITGYAVGGVPPLGHRTPLRTLMDRALLNCPMVYAAAGAGNAVFAVAPHRLREITLATITEATTA